MAKSKFFYNRVYNTKKYIINTIIIAGSIIGIILCFIFTSKFNGTNPSNPKNLFIKESVTTEINQNISKEMFFSKLENVNIDEIEITYPENFDNTKIGQYNIIIKINDKNYDSILNIVDTEKPTLTTKNATISENDNYTVNNFVSNCKDNSGKECIISFYKALDEEGNIIEYSKYSQSGTYTIQISAKDESGNETVKDARLTINKKDGTVTPRPTQDCKYGNTEYDTEKYLIAVSLGTNNCAISIELYKDEVTTERINKLMESETIKIRKEVDALNLNGRFALNRQISAIFNTSGTGLVGYELAMVVNITENGESKNVVSYKVNSDGKRIFTNNPYNLSE